MPYDGVLTTNKLGGLGAHILCEHDMFYFINLMIDWIHWYVQYQIY